MTVVAESSEKGISEEEVWPPGFRFHPTDEELVLYYLKRKVCRRKIKLDIIGETDVYKWDPEELPGLSSLKTGDRQWFFFSPRDRKYPNGARSNRATRHGYWKATGKDRIVTCNSRNVGVKKTLVFYKGRAPSGSRTDWVMHEYTLDEEEFKRCQNVKDYYALYKVFKKSGPGPKNGAQYGAPFIEDDWADVEYHGFNDSDNLEIPVKKLNEVASVADERESGEYLLSLDDIEELMNQIPDGPVCDILEDNDNLYSRPQIFGQEAESTVVDPSSLDLVFLKQDKILHSSDQLCDVQRSLDFTNSAISQLPSSEIREVSSTFAPNCYEGQSQVLAEEDFLEIDDLIGSEPSLFVPVKPANNLLIENMDAFGELDMFHDTAMFLHDLGPIDHGTVSEIYLTEHEKSMANQLECQLQSNSDCLNQSTNQLWIGDQPSNIFNLSESHQAYASQPTAGNEGDSDGGAVSRLSSSLWSFVESIPTTPASASENTLVNRAFGRMSSFKKLTINPRSSQVSIDSDTACKNRAGKVRGFFLVSVIVALCAIFWGMLATFDLPGKSSVS